jgi:hypothetical protein
MSNSDSSHYVLRYNEITSSIEACVGLNWVPISLANNLGSSAGGAFYVNNESGSDLNAGGPATPLATIGAALAKIGSATSISDFNDPANSRWLIEVAPGVYTENLDIPTRQLIDIHLNNALVIGNVAWGFDGTVVDVSLIQQAKLILRGDDLRAQYPAAGMPLSGISGSVSLTTVGVHLAPFLQVHIIETGIGGQFITATTADLNFDTSLVLQSAELIGGISSEIGAAITLYADHCERESSESIGPVTGPVTLYVLNNTRFSGAVVPTGASGGRWTNVAFASAASDFSGYSGTVSMDSVSFNSFIVNVPTPGTFPIVLLDGAKGIAYTPTVSGNWSTVPTTVAQALDLIAAKVNP